MRRVAVSKELGPIKLIAIARRFLSNHFGKVGRFALETIRRTRLESRKLSYGRYDTQYHPLFRSEGLQLVARGSSWDPWDP